MQGIQWTVDYETLKARHRAERENWPNNLSLRIHRALSWLDRAERCGDADGRFIFLWIAFNAAYAREVDLSESSSEKARFYGFLGYLADLDTEQDCRFRRLIWDNYTESVQGLLKNPYIFNDFWLFQDGLIDEEEWKGRFSRANDRALNAWMDGDTAAVLRILFSRLYVLRNQLMHGAATWNGSTNEEQVVTCANLMGELVPAILEIMMSHPQHDWGEPCYPVIRS
jgi:hypothetical protein